MTRLTPHGSRAEVNRLRRRVSELEHGWERYKASFRLGHRLVETAVVTPALAFSIDGIGDERLTP